MHTVKILSRSSPAPLAVWQALCLATTSSTSACATAQRCFSSQEASTTSSATQQEEREETIEQIRARVFDHYTGDGKRSGRKPLLQPLKGGWVANYYYTPSPNEPLVENVLEAE